MKKIIFLGITALIAGTCFAQFSKGDKLIEASFGDLSYRKHPLKSNEGSGGKSFSIALVLKAGYFISPKMAVGSKITTFFYTERYSSVNANNIKISESSNTQLNLTVLPFVRYYFKQNNKSRFFGELAAGIITYPIRKYQNKIYDGTTGALVSTTTQDRVKNNYAFVIPSVGWNYFITTNTALHLIIGYTFEKFKTPSYEYTTTYENGRPSTSQQVPASKSYSEELRWDFGFTIILPHKKK